MPGIILYNLPDSGQEISLRFSEIPGGNELRLIIAIGSPLQPPFCPEGVTYQIEHRMAIRILLHPRHKMSLADEPGGDGIIEMIVVQALQSFSCPDNIGNAEASSIHGGENFHLSELTLQLSELIQVRVDKLDELLILALISICEGFLQPAEQLFFEAVLRKPLQNTHCLAVILIPQHIVSCERVLEIPGADLE